MENGFAVTAASTAHRERTSSSTSSSGSGFNSRTNSSSSGAAIPAAFETDDDGFGAFATAAPAAATNFYPDVFSSSAASSSSSISFTAPIAPPPLSVVPTNAFSQSGLSEVSFDDEYDNPFADIVNEPPRSAGASRTNSFSSSGGVFDAPQQQQQLPRSMEIEMGSPLLSFSPVVAPRTIPSTSSMPDIFSGVASSAPSTAAADVFSLSTSSAPSSTDAELLSFSPLSLSSSAPAVSSLSGFVLDPPPAAAASTSKISSSFALPPPRAATMPSSMTAVSGSSVKSASLSGEVSVGELLSFSPVASAPVSSFSDSIGSSNAAPSTSVFGDDDLFSLSTADMTIDVAAPTVVASTKTSSASPVGSLHGSSVLLSEPTSKVAISQMEVALDAEVADEVVVVDAVTEHEVDILAQEVVQLEFATEEVRMQQQDLSSGAVVEEVIRDSMAAGGEDKLSRHSVADGEASEEVQQQPSIGDDIGDTSADIQHIAVPSPVGYSQFEFITQDFSPQASQSKDQENTSVFSPVGGYEQQGDDTSGYEAFTDNSQSDYAQYDTFSQGSIGDQYAPMGDSSDEELEGRATSPSAVQDVGFFSTANGTTAGSESTFTATVDQYANGRDDTTPSSHSSGEDFDASEAERNSFGGFEASANATAPRSEDGFGTAPASENLTPNTQSGDSYQGSSGNVEHGDVAATGGFSGFGSPSASVSIASGGPIHSEVQFGASTSDQNDDEDDFGDFGAANSGAANLNSLQQSMTASSFPASNGGDDEFGDFSHGTFASGEASDDFGDFAQSSNIADDDFGDFGQSSSAGGDDDAFTDFQRSSSFGNSLDANPSASDGDDFGDFSPPQPAASSSFGSVTAPAAPLFVQSTAKHDLQDFFSQAFPVHSTPSVIDTSLQTATFYSQKPSDLFQDKRGQSSGLIESIYRAAVESYFVDASADAADPAHATGAEHYLSELKATRLKHLKYVLTEKIQEASRHDGIFPHGSEKHHVLLSLVNSDDEQRMRDALTSVQNSLFHSSVNDAMMRIARQAALSAKAKIAEQAAHQQASGRGSLLATTRQLLSRTAGTNASASGKDHSAPSPSHLPASSASLGVLTPTGASVHKISRFAFAGSAGHENEAAGTNGNSSGDDTSSENSTSPGDSSHHSGSHESEFSAAASSSSSRNSGSGGGGGGSGGGSGGGGLMKKFQDRFSSFSASRSRTRLVSLRRMGQSGEDVRKMELNMESISGGFDEVKWKCAVFLYDVDEVSQVAPSQINILAYPSKEVLSGKTDRAVLMKFLKPGAIWTIDIGATNNDVLNEW